MNIHVLFSTCLLLLFPVLLWTQNDWQADYSPDSNLRFEAIGTEDGLPHKTVNALFQDHLGFIWLGTPIGLVKYDGYNFQTYQYETLDSLSGHSSLVSINVTAITEDSEGDLWVACVYERLEKPVLFRFDRETEKLVPYLFEANKTIFKNSIQDIHIGGGFVWFNTPFLFRMKYPDPDLNLPMSDGPAFEQLQKGTRGLQHDRVSRIKADSKGRIWLPTGNGVEEWKSELDTFYYHELSFLSEDSKFESYVVNNFAEAEDGTFWIFPNKSGYIMRFDPEKGTRKILQNDQYIGAPKLLPTTSGQFWLGQRWGRGGIQIFDLVSESIESVNIQLSGSLFFPITQVKSMLQDLSGTIWIGTEHGPLLKYEKHLNHFHWLHFQTDNENTLSHNWVMGIQQDRVGDYWFSTFGGGLNRWSRQKGSFQHIRTAPGDPNGLLSDFLLGLELAEDGKIWFGEGFSAGSFDPATGMFEHYREGGLVMSTYEDAENRIWLAKFGGGLRRYDPLMNDFRAIGIPNPNDSTRKINPPMSGIFQDSRGDLWLGSHAPTLSGFFRFTPETETFETFDLPESHVFCEDQRGYIWIGSVDGLYRFDPEKENFKRYGVEDGLPNQVITAIQPDDAGRLWVASNNGLSCFDPQKETFRNYFKSDGIPAGNFHQTIHKNEQGELFFGGTFGLLYFHPDSIQDNTIPPRLAITGIDLFGKPLAINEKGPLNKHVSLASQISFSHWQNDLTIYYAALHFKNPEKNNYLVKLDNYDTDWRHVGVQHFAGYTNLDPGHYTFRVKAANSDGIWNEEGIALDIIIRSPWYWNWWSKILYILLTIVAIVSLYRFQLKRRLALAETDRLRELDEVKTKLYTNITHEFRTPLTVINGVSDQIKDHKQEKEIIHRNSQNLLNLVNRMLDLSKVVAGELKPRMIQGDIMSYLSYITESFHSLALNQKINLNFYSDLEELEMDYDPEKTLEIMSNLISNAIKFTLEYGKVTIIVRKKEERGKSQLSIKVKDTGIGIAAKDLPFIFDRFHQVDSSLTRQGEGTGIGLALTKELVDLMDGEIQVESQVGEGSQFTIILPINNKAAKEAVPEKSETGRVATLAPAVISDEKLKLLENDLSNTLGSPPLNELPRILIVEDNLDVLRFIASCLQGDYNLLFARNGQEGIEQGLAHIPDIIISDVMMPKVDGFELCQTLKEDERTSHIPIILLTARVNMESRIEGLEHGADAYLMKPFHQEELAVRLRKLIELRRKLQKRYNQAGFEPEPATEKEDLFVLKVRQLILDHLKDDPFGPEDLSELLLLHRSQLHRKLKALTGKSTSIFIREVRLQEGHRMLKQGELNVSQVAYAVGFSDPSFFSKVFAQRYGQPPSKI